jgi:heptosyltransferase-1
LSDQALKVLIVRLSSLGDVVQSLPVVHDVLQAYPNAQVDWVTEEAFAPLVQCVQGIRHVHVAAQRRWRKAWWTPEVRAEWHAFQQALQADAFDAVIDCQGLIKSALMARQARLTPTGFTATYANASELCSYEWPVRWLLKRAIPMERRVHAVERSRRLVGRALQLSWAQDAALCPPQVLWRFPSDVQGAELNVRAAPEASEVWLIHGTTRPDNEWPLAHWVDLAKRLQAQGYRLVLPYFGERELQRAQAVASQAGLPPDSLFAPGPLNVLAERMAHAYGVIGLDTGLSHLAVALNRRHVQLFSQPRMHRAGPQGCLHQKAVGGEQAPTLDEVWQAWTQVCQA